jgi:catechol 2,3-dioxygenase-like lactoylglutathione lyase family enzyme
MEPRITLITLGVADLERSIAFYRDGLGLPQRDGPDGIAFFETSGTRLSLYPREALAEDAQVSAEGSGFRGFTLAHNVRSPEDVDRTLREAVAAGATLVKPGQKVSWGGYSGYFQDPDGFLWEVAWNPHLPI